MLVIIACTLHDTSDNHFESVDLSLNRGSSPGFTRIVGDGFGFVSHSIQNVQLKPSDGVLTVDSLIEREVPKEIPDFRGTAVPAFKGPEIVYRSLHIELTGRLMVTGRQWLIISFFGFLRFGLVGTIQKLSMQ